MNEDEERERFEAWVITTNPSTNQRVCDRHVDPNTTWYGQYVLFRVQYAWEAWRERAKEVL
jgi:hypothetical protein